MQIMLLGNGECTFKMQCGLNDFVIVDSTGVNAEDNLLVVNTLANISALEFSVLDNIIENDDKVGTVGVLTTADFASNARDDVMNWFNASTIQEPSGFYVVKENTFDFLYISKNVLKYVELLSVHEMMYNPDKVRLFFEEVRRNGFKNLLCGMAVVSGDLLYTSWMCCPRQEIKQVVFSISNASKLYRQMYLNNGRNNVLHYLLADFREGHPYNIGGTQLHVRDMVEFQKYHYNTFVLCRDANHMLLTEYVDDEVIEFSFECDEMSFKAYTHSKIHEDIYGQILDAIKIDLVHIHHTMWLPLDIYHVASEKRIPIIFSAHDYYYVCPELKMLTPKNELCDKAICKNNCENCTTKSSHETSGEVFLAWWHKNFGEILGLCEKIVFPSQFARNVFLNTYPEIDKKSVVIEHGILVNPVDTSKKHLHDKLRIAFLGGISDIKGGDTIKRLIKSSLDVDWFIIGGIGYEPLYHYEKRNLKKLGWYKQREVAEILNQNEIDLVCILSIVNETFCYTLSEAVAARIPVIATDVGALGIRMKQYNCGWLVSREDNYSEIFSLIKRISVNQELLVEKRNIINKIPVRGIGDMGADYIKLYNNLINDNAVKYTRDAFEALLDKKIEKEKTSGGISKDESVNISNENKEAEASASSEKHDLLRILKQFCKSLKYKF